VTDFSAIGATHDKIPKRTLIAGLPATLVVLAAGGVARARTSFDGIWSVTIITDSGACDRAYRAPVRIANGQVASEGDQSFNIFIIGLLPIEWVKTG
jgi:hypothetical protein